VADGGGSLDDRAFVSTSVEEGGSPRPLVEGTDIRLTFGGDGNLSARAGCNTILGTWRLDGDTLAFGGGGMTEMGCDEALHEQDQWLLGFLETGPTVQLSDDELVLTSGDTVLRLLDREVAEPDRALAGATWQVESLYLSGDAVSSVPAGATASLTFEEDGTLLVDGGCNRGRGTWVVEGDTLQIGPVAMTRKFCDGAPGELEAHVVQVLSAESLTYSIDAATLTIMADEVGLGLRQP